MTEFPSKMPAPNTTHSSKSESNLQSEMSKLFAYAYTNVTIPLPEALGRLPQESHV